MTNVTARREYSGGAVQQVTTTDMTNTSLVVNIDASTNWPTGAASTGFFVLVAEGTAAEEKMFVQSRTGNQLTILNRGADGSTAFAHPAGAKIRCWYTAQDADEANQHTSSTNAVHGVTGNILGDADVQNVYNKFFDATNQWTDFTQSLHDHSSPAAGGPISHGVLQPLTYASGWADLGGGNAVGGYRTDASGYVKFQGLINATTASGAVNLATAVPPALDATSHYFPVYDTSSGTWGQVQLVGTTLTFNSSAVTGHHYTLDGIGYQS